MFGLANGLILGLKIQAHFFSRIGGDKMIIQMDKIYAFLTHTNDILIAENRE